MNEIPSKAAVTPCARAPVADPKLWRPDWTAPDGRPSDVLWLDKNENADPDLTALVYRELAALGREVVFTYPDAAPVYAKLATLIGCASRELVFTAGSDGAIRSVFEAYVSPGDAVVHTRPTFAMYAVYARMYGARAVPVAYERGEAGPRLPVDALLETIAREQPRLVCLPNPDSPTGTVLEESCLRAVIEAAAEVGAVMLVDEAYHPFYQPSVLPWIRDYGHLVVARTFAKAWGMAGARVGYAAACAPLTALLHKVRPMYEVNTIGLALVERMLDHVDEVMASVQRINEGKRWFLETMRQYGVDTLQGHGNFLHVDFGQRAEAVHTALAGRVLYRKAFRDPCLAGYSRFTAAPQAVLDPVARFIAEALF